MEEKHKFLAILKKEKSPMLAKFSYKKKMFVLLIFLCSLVDNPLGKKEIAKFGYIPYMNIHNNKDFFGILATYLNLSLKFGDLELFCFNNLANFFNEKSFA
jgi:hypothetical protein